jgi:hypothetical protein
MWVEEALRPDRPVLWRGTAERLAARAAGARRVYGGEVEGDLPWLQM